MMREMKGALAATVVLAAVAVACVHGARMAGDGFNAMGRVAHGGGGARMPRPDHNDYPAMARWLVHENLWGVMGTTSNSTGLPWTNVVDMSDGAVCESTGRLLFYLTEMDETARDVSVRPKVSFSIAEAALGCGATDAEVRVLWAPREPRRETVPRIAAPATCRGLCVRMPGQLIVS